MAMQAANDGFSKLFRRKLKIDWTVSSSKRSDNGQGRDVWLHYKRCETIYFVGDDETLDNEGLSAACIREFSNEPASLFETPLPLR